MLPCDGRSPNVRRKATLVSPEQNPIMSPDRASNRFADDLTPAERAQGIRGIATLHVTTEAMTAAHTTEESANSQRPEKHGSLCLFVVSGLLPSLTQASL